MRRARQMGGDLNCLEWLGEVVVARLPIKTSLGADALVASDTSSNAML